MNPIHIHTQIDSTTLHLPQIEPLLGKHVEIIVQEESLGARAAGTAAGTGNWEAFQKAAHELSKTYDFDAMRAMDEASLEDAEKTAKMWE
jgi:hypothetical protein